MPNGIGSLYLKNGCSFYFLRCDLVKDWRRGNLRTLVREASIFYAALGERSKPSAFQAEDHRFESGTRYHIKGRYSNSPFNGKHSSINYLGIKSAYVNLPCFYACVAQLARAIGSYPIGCWFKSNRRSHCSTQAEHFMIVSPERVNMFR